MVPILRHLILAMSVVSWACVGTSDSVPHGVVREDSSGVEIVTNLTALDSLPVMGTSSPPTLAIRPDEDDAAILYRVSDVARGSDGSILVGSRGAFQVYVFAPDGTLDQTLGREGDGPGEFQAIESILLLPPDSVAVYDAGLKRLTVFGSNGAAARTVDVSSVLPARGWSRMHPLPDGFALAVGSGLAPRSEPGPYRGEAYSFRVTMEGDSAASYGPFPGLAAVRTDQLMGPLPFGGTMHSATRGDRLIIGTADGPQVQEYRPDGALVRVIRWPDRDRRVTSDDMSAFVESLVEGVPEERRASSREMFEAMPHAPEEPAYHNLLVSDHGDLWVGDYPGPAAVTSQAPMPARRWLVIDANGVTTHVVETPHGFRPMRVHDDRLLGVHTDELGVESVLEYRFGSGRMP